MSRTWFITGAGRGFGSDFIPAARRPRRRDHTLTLTGAARRPPRAARDRLLVLDVDVTSTEQVQSGVREAVEHFGRLDGVVDDAGHGLTGAADEITEQQLRDVLEVALLGPVRVVQAVLPKARRRTPG